MIEARLVETEAELRELFDAAEQYNSLHFRCSLEEAHHPTWDKMLTFLNEDHWEIVGAYDGDSIIGFGVATSHGHVHWLVMCQDFNEVTAEGIARGAELIAQRYDRCWGVVHNDEVRDLLHQTGDWHKKTNRLQLK